MAIVLAVEQITEKSVKSGFDYEELTAGQKVQIRHGSLENPTTMFLDTVPEGKIWNIRISVYIEETDA